MAEENEIQILIKLVDEMSGKISNIETSLNKFSKTAEKQNEKIANSFQDSTDSLIAVGNAASSVDSIFSSLTNLEIRLENATERVSGAEDRLYDAQYNLNKVMKSGTATAEDVAKAQKDVESATRSLTISQNNLERAKIKLSVHI
jgi:chromosome segregation ATPase